MRLENFPSTSAEQNGRLYARRDRAKGEISFRHFIRVLGVGSDIRRSDFFRRVRH